MYWDCVGKEAQFSLCPSGICFRFEFINLVLCLNEFWFSLVESCARDDELFLDDFVTLCSYSKPSSLVLYPPESRVSPNRSCCILEKTLILLGISSIPPKPWSNSSIPSVDVFTRPLWPCLQILVRFGLDLATRSLSSWKNAGWKTFLDRVLPSTG